MDLSKSHSTHHISEQAPASLSRWLVWIMATTCGLVVANLYYLQPVLADLGRTFNVTAQQIGIVVTLGQLGYASGLLLIVPLGDSRDRRGLTVTTLVAVSIALVAVAIAPSFIWLAVASFAVGALTVGAQVIVPFAASLANPKERGQVVGIVMSGLLIGILLARTISGSISAHFGWRTMYWIAAVTMLLLAGTLRVVLPQDQPRTSISYPQLLRSMWHLLRKEPVLRETSVLGGLIFGAFSAFWVTLAFFLETPPYHYGSEVAGLFGLVGVVGALAASLAGKLADRMDARRTGAIAMAISLVSFVLFWLAGHWLWGLIVGVILLDLGTQAAHISNQTRVYSLDPQSRNRLNTVYMVSYFIGGSIGSTLATFAWSIAGWDGVCAVGILLLVVALGIYAVMSIRQPYNKAQANAAMRH